MRHARWLAVGLLWLVAAGLNSLIWRWCRSEWKTPYERRRRDWTNERG